MGTVLAVIAFLVGMGVVITLVQHQKQDRKEWVEPLFFGAVTQFAIGIVVAFTLNNASYTRAIMFGAVIMLVMWAITWLVAPYRGMPRRTR